MKAILVFDVPSICDECKCNLRGRCVPMDENTPTEKGKPSWCPLRPVPSEYCVNHNGDGEPDWWAVGYNRAIRDIAGEEDG